MSPERINRRDVIIDIASRLFITQGYEATSVRQIAEEVGVTEAALYYHFKDGKRELLQCVAEHAMPDLMQALVGMDDAQSLYEFITRFVTAVSTNWPPRMARLRWVISEFPRWNDEERAIFHRKHRRFQDAVVAQVARFVDDDREAYVIGYTLMCALFGYGNLFINMNLDRVSDFKVEEMGELLATSLAKGR